jgi:hypothetical protein
LAAALLTMGGLDAVVRQVVKPSPSTAVPILGCGVAVLVAVVRWSAKDA